MSSHCCLYIIFIFIIIFIMNNSFLQSSEWGWGTRGETSDHLVLRETPGHRSRAFYLLLLTSSAAAAFLEDWEINLQRTFQLEKLLLLGVLHHFLLEQNKKHILHFQTFIYQTYETNKQTTNNEEYQPFVWSSHCLLLTKRMAKTEVNK